MNIATPSSSLVGQVIAITGGGDGIGRATAHLSAQRGAAVAVVDRRADAARAVARELTDGGARAIAIEADVSSESDIDAVMQCIRSELGVLSGIVNNAGTIVTQPLVDTTMEHWDRVMNVNAKGVFLGCRAAVREFLSTDTAGSIVNTGSISATVGLPHQAAYCASKGAVLQLSRQIAVDYAHLGIRCNVVSPGSVQTAVLDDYLADQPDPERARTMIVAEHPLARLAAPAEIAEAICFALSPAASFITGANLPVDGGYTAR